MNWLKRLVGCRESYYQAELAGLRIGYAKKDDELYEAKKEVRTLQEHVSRLEKKVKVLKAYKARQKAKK